MIGYGVCVGSWEKFERNIVPRTGLSPLIGVANASSIAEAYNAILDAYRGQNMGLAALVLLHDDLEIIDPDFEAKVVAALAEPDVAIVGVVGAGTPRTLAWWNYGLIGHQLTDTHPVAGSVLTGDVACTDGSIMALSPWAMQNLRFDTRYTGFHGYDSDIGMQAHGLGKRVVVADIQTHHHTTLGFKSPEIQQAWDCADAQFQAKWWMT